VGALESRWLADPRHVFGVVASSGVQRPDKKRDTECAGRGGICLHSRSPWDSRRLCAFLRGPDSGNPVRVLKVRQPD
jgi:hypothetical protein